MIESIDNMIQLVVTGACTSICLYRAVRGQGRLCGCPAGIFLSSVPYTERHFGGTGSHDAVFR